MRQPGWAIVIDSSVLIAMALGRSSYALVAAVKRHRLLVTDIAAAESQKRIELGLKAPEHVPDLRAAVALMNMIPAADLPTEHAKAVLRDAVASRNGSVADAHILACAWTFDADIWSSDRDFAGTGVASWSTANLMRALEQT